MRTIPVTLVIGLLAASSAQALVMVASANTGVRQMDSYQSLQVPQFDPAQGTLGQVTLTVTALLQGDLQMQNLGPATDGTLNLDYNADLTVIQTHTKLMTLKGHAQDVPVMYSLGEGESMHVAVPLANDVQTYVYTSPQDLAAFIGTGTVNFMVKGNSHSMNASGLPDEVGALQFTEGRASIKVAYETIPEPATVSLLTLGATLLFRRRRGRLIPF